MTEPSETRRRAIESEDLFRLKIVGDADISRDGSRVAYVVRLLDKEKDEYVGNIHVWKDGIGRQFTSGGKDSTPRWSPDGSHLAFLSGRADKSQIFVMPTSGGEATQLTKLEMGAGEPIWSPDSKSILFAAATPFPKKEDKSKVDEEKRRPTKVIDRAIFKFDGQGFNHDRRTHIFCANVETRSVEQLTEGDFNHRNPTWSPDGRHVMFASNRSPNWDTERGSDLWIMAAEGGEPTKVTHRRGAWYGPTFSPDGSRIAYLGFPIEEDKDPDHWPEIWIADRSGEEIRNILEGTDLDEGHSIGSDWAGSSPDVSLTWRPTGIYFLSSVRATCNVMRWDGDGVEAVTHGDHDVSSFSVSDDGSIAYVSSDPTHPTEAFLQRDGQTLRLSHENDEMLAELQMQEPERLAIEGFEGHELDGWIMKPVDFQPGQKYAVLLYIHGGPATAYGYSFFHELQWWAAQGYGVAFSNPRGGSSYGRDFQDCIRHDWGNKDYQDVMSFLDEIVKMEWVDEKRLAAAGGSYGGYMVNWLAGHTDRFAAFCTQRSICNMVSQGGTSDFAAFRHERSGGTPEGNPEILWNQSPLKFASNVKTPTLILHQEQDHRCPIEQGEQWFSALKRLGVPTRFIRFPDESHGLSRNGKPSRRVERLGYMREWFGKYV